MMKKAYFQPYINIRLVTEIVRTSTQGEVSDGETVYPIPGGWSKTIFGGM